MKPEDKIYAAYFESKKDTLYFNEIKELSKLSDSSLSNALDRLVKSKTLRKEKTKSNTFYKMKDKKKFALKFSEIAVQHFYALNLGVRSPLRNFLKNIPNEVYTIVLFGSSSIKKEKKGSDIDVLIVSDLKYNFQKLKKEADAFSNHPLSLFRCSLEQFVKNEDHVVIQARKTGYPVWREQNFYEVVLNEH